MANYMQANQPYNRVTKEDGTTNGFLIGGAMGAAGAKGVRSASRRISQSEEARNARYSQTGASNFIKSGGVRKTIDKHRSSVKAPKGGWKGRAAAYGGSVLAGGILGAVTDSFQD